MGTLPHISTYSLKALDILLIIFFLFVLAILMIKTRILLASFIAFFPLIIYMVIRMIDRPDITFLSVFTVTYFIMGLTRYINGLQGGIVLDGLLLFTFFITMFSSLGNSKF